MKSYLIGRELNCDIVINDPSNIVSRHHATLNVEGSGKMTIVDRSSNGTYINGIRISPNTPVPVTRKDVVSFAKAANLDWSKIRNPAKTWIMTAAAVIILGVFITAAVWFINTRHSGYTGGDTTETTADTAKVSYSDTLTVIKKDVAALKTLYDETKRQMDSTMKIMDKKNPCDALERVKKMVYAVQPEFDRINLSELDRYLQRAEDNLTDKNEQVASLIKQLHSTIKMYDESLRRISTKLDESMIMLKKIKDKSTGKQDKPAKPNQSHKDTIQNII